MTALYSFLETHQASFLADLKALVSIDCGTHNKAGVDRVGEWVRQNGESVYGTSACPLPEAPWGRCTVKGHRIYWHVFNWPGDAVLRISNLHAEVAGAYLLAEPSRKLAVTRAHDGIGVRLPARIPDELDTVVVLELGGPLRVDPPIVTQGSDAVDRARRFGCMASVSEPGGPLQGYHPILRAKRLGESEVHRGHWRAISDRGGGRNWRRLSLQGLRPGLRGGPQGRRVHAACPSG